MRKAKEKWEHIIHSNGWEISSYGRVRKDGVIKKTSIVYKRRLVIFPKIHGEQNTLSVSRLVGKAFCPAYEKDLFAKYIDGDSLNCEATNLKWISRSEATVPPIGEKQGRSILKETDVHAIRQSHKDVDRLAMDYGVSATCIRDVVNIATWKHI